MLAGMAILMVAAPAHRSKQSVLPCHVHGREQGGLSTQDLTRGVRVHDGLGVRVGEVQAVAEEEGPDEGQLFEVVQRDGGLEQLPVGLQREELVDELPRVRQEVVVVVLVPEKIEKFDWPPEVGALVNPVE